MPDTRGGMVAAVDDDDGSELISLVRHESLLHVPPASLPLCRRCGHDVGIVALVLGKAEGEASDAVLDPAGSAQRS